jgi:selenide,water dikinase
VAALNRQAIETALNFEVHACTDVTGFGIMGHTLELARGNDVHIDIIYENLPFYPNALQMYQKGETTGSNKANRKLAEGAWEMAAQHTAAEEELLFDPQTSGGLLLVVPATQSVDLIARLKKEGIETAVNVGEVAAADQPFVRVV